ncbi:MAG: peptidoglycan editing factor PgeF [Pseudomonadales bacterium]|jgi:polyphenol oxidase|nr:peptidoglycan editing factor PgeF [Gammaproteobacteria bacterium]|tara:strand:- start:3260 stop:3952 length:693 start_codon:yes stop_codon:yes gene_type:complete
MNSLLPDWPAPMNIKVLFSDRRGGFSNTPYASLNLGVHVGDDADLVACNRASIDVPGEPFWLEQTHTDICINADIEATDRLGDASVTRATGKVLAIMVADCLPVMFTSVAGDIVGVAHAGWKGLADGVLFSTVTALGGNSVLAWMGPAIGPCHYTVGEDVRARFSSDTGFVEGSDKKFSMDLYAIAKEQLESLGVETYGGGLCTYCDSSKFFSYRRDGVTGRMGGFIWME